MANLDRDMLLKIIALVEEIQSGGSGASIDVRINGVSIVNNGVANIPVAGESSLGVVKTVEAQGIGVATSGTNANTLQIIRSPDADIKAGGGQFKPIVPLNQHNAVFYGLAKAAGDTSQASSSNAVGVYTSTAKAYIKNMLGITAVIPLAYDDNEQTYSCDYSFQMLQAMINNGCYLVVLFNDELYLPLYQKDSTSLIFSTFGVDGSSGVSSYIVRITTDGTDTSYEFDSDTYPNS